MKFYYKILSILSVVLIFIPSAFAVEESLEDIAKEINEVRQEISQLQSSNVKEAIIIDKALQELDQVMEFVGKSIENGDIKTAVGTLNFIERSISDVASIVPKEFKSKKVKENLKEFSKKDMNEIMEITQGVNKNKNKKTKKLINSMLESKMKGMNTLKISENLTDLGIKTIDKKEIKKVLTASTGTVKSSSITRELEDQKRFGFIIGNSPEEVDIAIKQIDAIRSADPKKQRAFEIEKYGLAAGVDKNTIAKGIEAVYSGNTDIEKKITFEILSKLGSNPSYNVAVPTMQEMDKQMNKAIAAEQAVYAVLNSGVNFGVGTKGSDVKKLAKEVESILSGTTDQETINRVVYSIKRTGGEIWRSPEQFAAMVKAELSGDPNQTLALAKLNIQNEFGPSTQSLVETAAEVEATLNGATEYYIDAKYTDLSDRLDLEKLTSSQQNELSKIYSSAIENYSEKRAITEVQSITKELQRTSAAASVATQKAAALSAEISTLKTEANLATKKSDETNKKIREMVQKGEMVSAKALREARQLQHVAGMANINLNQTEIKMNAAKVAADTAQEAADSAKKSASSVGLSSSEISSAVSSGDLSSAVSSGDLSSAISSSSSSVTSAAKEAIAEAKSSAAEAAKTAAAEATEVAKVAAAEAAEAAKEVAKTEAISAAESALAEAQSELESIYAEGRRTQSPMLTEISIQMQEIHGAKIELEKAKQQ